MLPAASVSGWYFAHPDARYFGVGRIGRDQVEDYARRKGMAVADAERWLAPNLGYEPRPPPAGSRRPPRGVIGRGWRSRSCHDDPPRPPRRRARPRVRRRDGHDALRQGRVHQRLLRRAEPAPAGAGAGGPRGLREGRRRDPGDEHLRRQPREARPLRPRGADRRDQQPRRGAGARGGRRPRQRRGRRSDPSASGSSRSARPRGSRRSSTSRRRPPACSTGGVDGFILETFSDVEEIHEALRAVRVALRPADRRADDHPGGRAHGVRHRRRRPSRGRSTSSAPT